MRRVPRMAVGLTLSLGFWCVVAVWASAAQDNPAPTFVAAKGTKVYHKPSCATLKRTLAKNKVELADQATAEAEGFKPCPVCKPGAEAGDIPTPATPAGKTSGKKGAGGKAVSTSPGVVFSRDVAPILIANCLGCHEGAQAKKQFDMSSFAKLMKGSATGKMIEPSAAETSELLLRVKGESQGRKMPPGNNTDLAQPTIDRIESWVRAGAVLDAGVDPNANLKSYAPTPDDLRRAELSRLNPEQRETLAESKGRERIKKASSQSNVEKQSSTHFVLLSSLPKERGDALLKGLESRITPLKTLLGPPSVPYLEGPVKVGVYVFNEPNAYAEFVRGVENRELESGTVAHANLAVESPYVVAVDPLGGNEDPNLGKKAASVGKTKNKKAVEESAGPERSLEGLLVEQLAAEASRRSGKPPQWLALGLGAYFASQVDPRGRYVAALRSNALAQNQLNWPAKVNDSLRGESDADAARAIGFSLVEWLASNDRAKLTPFVRALVTPAEKQTLDDLIKEGWNVSQDDFVAAWGNWVGTTYRRTRN